MTSAVIARRLRERAESLDRVRRWAEHQATGIPTLSAVVVFGSVARGDFNLWSDTDVLVVVGELPDDWLERCELLAPVPPGLEVVIWTVDELADARRKANPVAVEADDVGVTAWGELPATLPDLTRRPRQVR